jgi:Double zinc ribbon
MAETTTCAQCQARNDAGSSFCLACGASLAPKILCPSCNAVNGVGQRFCTRCGGSLEHAGWTPGGPPGAVVEGEWERGADELIRRVDPEDARRFLGARTVRVPVGSVGAVLVDGVVDRILPPGERTSLGLFERIASFFLGRDRTAFFLVDQRPFPIPFVVRTRPRADGQSVASQVLVTISLPRGDRDAMGRFIANVQGDRPSVSTGQLYDLLRPEVVRIAQDVLERAAATGGGEISYPDAEAEIRRALAAVIGPRYGLAADATLAPMTAVATLALHLGTGPAPAVRPCTKCRAELPVTMRFCDRCGERQPALVDPGEPLTAETPLFTADGQQVELDLVVRVQGPHEGFAPARLAPALVGAAAAQLRETPFAQLATPGGLDAVERAAGEVAAEALGAFGLSLVALAVIDVRSKTGQWLLAARADLARADEEVKLGLQWLEQRDAELDLEQLTLARILREQRLARDHRFARDEAEVADRERRDALAARGAAIDVAEAERRGQTRAAADAVEHARQGREAAHAIEQRRAAVAAELEELRARRDLDFAETERRRRLELELAAAEEAQQLEKLRGMAAIEREAAAAEQAHEIAKREMLRGLSPEEMIAMQAAELAKGEGGGAAWASAVAQRASAETERRHAEELRGVLERQHGRDAALYDKAIGAMAEVARSRAEAAPVVAGVGAGPVVTVASTAGGGAGAEAAARPCKSCGAGLKPEARFCGACGAGQGA